MYGYNRKILLTVIACPIPDCGLSGAMTNKSPKGFTASINERIPLEKIPSSLVTKIKGCLPDVNVFKKVELQK